MTHHHAPSVSPCALLYVASLPLTSPSRSAVPRRDSPLLHFYCTFGSQVGEMGASERLERPGTTAGGGRMTPKEAREQEVQRKLKERTDAMLKAVEESRTGSLGITQSRSAKTVAMARHEARPMTVNPMAGGRRRTRPTRSLHAFIRPNSVTELAPLAPIRGTNAKAQIAKSASLS